MQVNELKDKEMESISGGAIGPQIVNAVINAIEFIIGLGEKTGSTIRRLIEGTFCQIN